MDAVAIDGIMPEDDLPEPSTQSRLELPYRRILIYGVTGSGKTTIARKLSELTGIPWTEVDTLTWDPGWVEVPKEVQQERIREICAGDEWILDSAYGKWIDIPLEKVQLVVGLDYSRARSLLQLIWRTVSRAITKEEVCNGNVESNRGLLSRDSIVLWHYKSFHRKRERIHQWASEGKFEVMVLTHPRMFEEWISNLRMDALLKRHPVPHGLDKLSVVEHVMKFEDEL